MDSPIVELIKTMFAPLITGTGVLGYYLLHRKFEAETRESLRTDNKTLREDLQEREEENDKLRARLKLSDDENDALRQRLKEVDQ